MKDTLKVGLTYTHKYRVPENKTVPYLYPESKAFQEMPKVFATGFMVGLMEWACIEAMAPHMDPGEGSVGTLVNVTHTAATPPGMEVTVDVRCIGVDGRKTVWEIEARVRGRLRKIQRQGRQEGRRRVKEYPARKFRPPPPPGGGICTYRTVIFFLTSVFRWYIYR
ncbi:MAG: thioesterase superfamily protein [Actinobacteria bacterium]|nr:thioesterase superfamily protein [Actinomycetota bacterium]